MLSLLLDVACLPTAIIGPPPGITRRFSYPFRRALGIVSLVSASLPPLIRIRPHLFFASSSPHRSFGSIDKDFKTIMSNTAKNPNVVDACCEPGRLDALRTLGEKLDACQKSLSEYLNTKRNAFAR